MYQVDEQEVEAVKRVILSKKYFRYQGKGVPTECEQFEKNFAAFMGTDFSVLLSSGTNALVNALQVLGIGPGDEVLIPGFTFFATATAVMQVGATPIIVNIDEHLGMCPIEAETKITAKTKAMIPVHMDGLNCNMDALLSLAKKHKIFVIEDVAQAVGGSYKGKKLGSMGDLGCYSFNVDKIISCGEGGAIVGFTEAHHKRALVLHDTCSQFGATYKDFLQGENLVGHSMRVSEISAAMISVQLTRLDSIITGLRARKNIFVEALKDSAELMLAHDPSGDCGTSLHIKLDDPVESNMKAKFLLGNGFTALPISSRPAHAYWQWQHLLPKTSGKPGSDLLPTMEILSSSIKIFINLNLDLDETKMAAEKLQKLLRE